MVASLTTTIRLAPAAKRRLATAAKRRGVSTHKFILDAAMDRAAGLTDDAKLARLEALVARVHKAVEDEIDYRVAAARWKHHVKHKTPLYTGEEVWRDLGLPD